MVVTYLCGDCLPEGTPLLVGFEGFGDLKAPKPTHCYGRNNQVTPGVLGGYRCSCLCVQDTEMLRQHDLMGCNAFQRFVARVKWDLNDWMPWAEHPGCVYPTWRQRCGCGWKRR